MAARNFEDLLQCAIPVFDGLFPATQNQIVQDLLFTLAHWHGLSKLRMHSDLTLDIFDATTTDIGNQLRDFKVKVCSVHDAKELDKEVNARSRCQAKEAVRRTQAGKNNKSVTNGLLTTTAVEEPVDHNKLRRTVSFNLQTYKIHALGDYVSCIRRFGTTDSYSTEPHLDRENWNTALARDDILEQIGNPSYASSLKLSVAKPKKIPLDRSTPAWPTQLGRYAQKVRRVPPLVPDFTVQGLQFDLLKNEVYGEWEEFVHLSGATYYYNRTRKAYTGFNVRDCSSDCLDKFEAWVKATRAQAHEDLLLVAEPARTQNVDGDVYLYYLVALEARIIGWLETFDGTHLFRECDSARQWNHKHMTRTGGPILSFSPETSSWIASFYDNCELNLIGFTQFHLGDYIFQQGNYGETHQLISQSRYVPACCSILSHLDDRILDDLSESEGIITEPGVALLGRLYHMLRHHQYLNYFGQPEARLLRTHSMGPGTRTQGPFPFILTVAMLCLPVLVREHLKQIYVDGLVNYLDLKDFINDFNIQNNAQITLAGVIMVINAGFLAVQGVGTGLVAESMLKGSIIFCVGCLFAGMFNGGGPVPKVLNVAAR
ncbi:hypothetical protein DEU56DRAFT_917278 [Suillus clintonianus]|uniref:uncharacterized protein n=1 Tax=Suillus clintonianus TaxID=1904413 RepID=UPI001B86ABCD|nr:uncharacterized protein DEU56DRAFT_917278 [Suillus clintonianus]KAG2123872.1 hypothetical protein DEU56DRAFT_917278 [Suillus clintonianus]